MFQTTNQMRYGLWNFPWWRGIRTMKKSLTVPHLNQHRFFGKPMGAPPVTSLAARSSSSRSSWGASGLQDSRNSTWTGRKTRPGEGWLRQTKCGFNQFTIYIYIRIYIYYIYVYIYNIYYILYIYIYVYIYREREKEYISHTYIYIYIMYIRCWWHSVWQPFWGQRCSPTDLHFNMDGSSLKRPRERPGVGGTKLAQP